MYAPSISGVARTALPRFTDHTVAPVEATNAENHPPSLPA